MVRLAITGGIACGKSLVGSFLTREDIPVCDADDLAHEVMEKGTPVHAGVVRSFGVGILDADGRIDRKRLADVVFASPARLAELNSLVHPEVRRKWEAWLAGLEGRCPVAAVIIPLLYETGCEKDWDLVLCVGAREEDQRARLGGRGLAAEDVERRIAAQLPVSVKMERADRVVFNCGSVEFAEEQTGIILKELLERQHA